MFLRRIGLLPKHNLVTRKTGDVSCGQRPWVGVNWPPPSVAYMRQWTVSALVQVMACRLFGAKPLPEPMLFYWQLDSWEQISVKFESRFYHFCSRKCIWKCCLPKMMAILSRGGWVNMTEACECTPLEKSFRKYCCIYQLPKFKVSDHNNNWHI